MDRATTTAPAKPALTIGSPCPAGCALEWPNHKQPERLRANDDGELSCPDCWDNFGMIATTGTCRYCHLDIRLLGGMWTDPDGTTSCTANQPSEPVSLPHEPEG